MKKILVLPLALLATALILNLFTYYKNQSVAKSVIKQDAQNTLKDSCECDLVPVKVNTRNQQKNINNEVTVGPEIKKYASQLSLGTIESEEDHTREYTVEKVYNVTSEAMQKICMQFRIVCRYHKPEDEELLRKMLGQDLTPTNKVVVPERPGNGSRKSQNDTSQKSFMASIEVLNKERDFVRLIYQAPNRVSAKIKMTIDYKDKGIWHHWHRDDLIYKISANQPRQINLADAGFHFIPDDWRFSVFIINEDQSILQILNYGG